MAKDKTGNNNNVDGVVASNKKIAESLKEISNQAAVFEVLAAGVAKFREELEEASEVLSEQVEKLKAFDQLANSMDKSAKGAQQLGGAISKQAKESKKAAEALGFKKSGSGYADNKNIFEELNKSSKAARIGINAMAGAMKVLSSVGKLVSGVISGVVSVISSVIDSIVTLGKGIFNFIVELYEGLFETAKEYRQGTVEYLREVENVREKFGNVAMGVGKAVVDMGKQIFSGSTAGLSGFALFEDKADALRKMSEMASAGGAAFELLIDQFRGKNLNDLYAFKEGLGLTNEEFAGMMKYSITVGRPIKGLMMEVQKYARGLTNEFGGSAKAFKSVSRDIVKARMDVRHFANVSIKDLASAAMYARKLGLELEKLTGIMDAFDTFDAAAENVSKLSQAFGVNLDVMELMNAKTSTEQIDMIKKAFNAAGRSVEDMNRQELKYLSQTLQLDEATVQQALSTKNQGEAMDKLKDSTKSMENQMLSTAEALVDVMGEIKKVVRELAQITSKGFFGTFFEGFTEGIARSAPFRNMMFSWAQAIQHVWQAGTRLGQMFVEHFPGIKDMLQGIAKIMPRINELFDKFSKTLSDFFRGLEAGQVDIGKLFDKLWSDMKGFFDSIDPQFGRGASKFFETIKVIAQQAIVFLIEQAGNLIAALFEGIADYMERPDSVSGITSSVQGGINKAIKGTKDFFAPIRDAFGRSMEKIGPQFERVWDKVISYIEKSLTDLWSRYKWEIILTSLTVKVLPGLLQFFSQRAFQQTLLTTIQSATGQGLQAGVSSSKGVWSAVAGFISTPLGAAVAGIGATLGGYIALAATQAMDDVDKRVAERSFKKVKERYAQLKQEDPTGKLARDFIEEQRDVFEKRYAESSGQGSFFGRLEAGARELTGTQKEETKLFASQLQEIYSLMHESAGLGAGSEVEATLKKLESQEQVIIGKVTGSSASQLLRETLRERGITTVEALTEFYSEMDAKAQEAVEAARHSMDESSYQSPEELMFSELKSFFGYDAGRESKFEASLSSLTAQKGDALKDVAREHMKKESARITDDLTDLAREYLAAPAGGEADVMTKIQELLDQSGLEGFPSLSELTSEKLKELAERTTAKDKSVQEKMAEQGRKAREEMLATIGPTTIDNVEERFEKIREIGEKVLGKEQPIQDTVKAIQDSLDKIDFTVMRPEQLTKFNEQLGSVIALDSMLTKIKNMVVTVSSIPQAFAGLGSAGEKGSTMYKFVDSMIAYGKAMHDIGTVFTGGKLSDETEFVGRAEIGKDVMTAIDTYTKDVDAFSGAINQLKGAGEGFKNALDALIPVMGAVAERRAKANEALAASFGADPAAYASQKIKSDTGRVSEATAKMKSQVARAMSEVDGKVSVSLRDALEGRGQFTVRTEPLNLSVKITVGLDPTKLEGIILEQEKSIILDTFNKVGGKLTPATSFTVTPGPTPGTGTKVGETAPGTK